MKTFLKSALFIAGAIVLGTVAYGQTSEMKASIPFAFRTATGTLPAGEYTISDRHSLNGSILVVLRNSETKHAVLVLGSPVDTYSTGTPAVLFHCESEGCAMVGLRSSEGTVNYAHYGSKSRKAESAAVAIPLRPSTAD